MRMRRLTSPTGHVVSGATCQLPFGVRRNGLAKPAFVRLNALGVLLIHMPAEKRLGPSPVLSSRKIFDHKYIREGSKD
jgi:hypothetical protein